MLFRLSHIILTLSLVLAGILFSQILLADQADLDAERDYYIKIFQGSNFTQHREAMEKLAWTGISDPAIYDLILDKYNALLQDQSKAGTEKAAWYAKGLGRSGNQKYDLALAEGASQAAHKKIRKYSAKGKEHLAIYKVWNPIIAKGNETAPSGQLEQARIKNMVESSNYTLVRHGTKYVYDHHSKNSEMVAMVRERLLREYKSADEKRGKGDQVDAVAWMIKTLAESEDSVNKPAIQEIVDNTKPGKIQKYAKKYVGYL